jgi:hypothetical protein
MTKQTQAANKWKFSKMVPTKDDFCPTFPEGTVQCSVYFSPETVHFDSAKNKTKKPCVMMSVWGDDDFGFERLEYFDNKGVAKSTFRKRKEEVSKWTSVTIDGLRKIGFLPA